MIIIIVMTVINQKKNITRYINVLRISVAQPLDIFLDSGVRLVLSLYCQYYRLNLLIIMI
ncbi:hypothetical protein DERF_002007 [Dermatophagoides farinae]|uniref:Uncharacterized protein n=1 Tax=Dermatophagoides farinae TaxID=6954 RepID=A0A922IFX1_DERFA|nr:hypothetical protein DERF_002007 [Dermatophagoides farinae]